MDIDMFKYPCAMVSVDKVDSVGSHIMNIKQNIKKIRIDQRQKQLGEYLPNKDLNTNQNMEIVKKQIRNKEGCKVIGDFTIKLVSGNFHIAFHDYIREFRTLIQQGYGLDFSHRINSFYFGQRNDTDM